MRPSTFRSSAKMAIAQVLTNPTLLKYILSYQGGVPLVAGLLLERYRAEVGASSDALVALSEAIMYYHDFDVLSTVWRQLPTRLSYTVNAHDLHAMLCSAACTFDRLDMLQWIYFMQNDVEVDESRVCADMKTCAVTGQLRILEWLDSNFRSQGRRCLQLDCGDIVKAGHVNVLQWMADQRLGPFPTHTLTAACKSGNLEVVRFLLAQPSMFETNSVPTLVSLLETSVACGHMHLVKYFVLEKKIKCSLMTICKLQMSLQENVAVQDAIDFLQNHCIERKYKCI